jgi:hypothetical protein
MTLFAFGFVRLDAGIVWGVIGDIHRSAASGLGTGQVFMLEGLDKPTVRHPLLF